MNFPLRSAAFLTLLLATSLAAADKKVVLISIDGLRGRTLAALPSRHLKTPNLNEMVERGTVSTGLVGVFPTVTYPSHTTAVTGVAPAEHGIYGNTYFDPERKLNGAWYYYAEQIKVPTLWDAAKQRGLTTAAVSWPVTVGAKIDANFPEYRPVRTFEDRLHEHVLTTPGLFAEFEKANGPVPMQENDHTRAAMASYLIKTRKPDLLLVHLIDVDHEEHGFGPDSPEAFKALETIDECIGQMRAAVKAAGLEAQTTFVVVSDHGFWPVEKLVHPRVVLANLGLTAPEGKPEQWRVEVHQNGGSFALIAKNPSDSEAMKMAEEAFRKLHDEGNSGIAEVYTKDQLQKLGAYPDAFFAVSVAEGFTVGGARNGNVVTPSPSTKGMHGYAPGPEDLDASFVALGRGVSKANVGRAHLVDVAPTVASLLGLPWSTPGKNLLMMKDSSR